MREPPCALLVPLAVCLSITACDKAPKPSAQDEQAEAFTRAYVAVTQKRPPEMHALDDTIGSHPAQCEMDQGIACKCTWRFRTPTGTKEIVALGAPPQPTVDYVIRLRNNVTGNIDEFRGETDAHETSMKMEDTIVDHYGVSCSQHPEHPKCKRIHDFIDDERYFVFDSSPGADAAPWPRMWMSGRQLRTLWTTRWFFASQRDVVSDVLQQKFARIGPAEALPFCTTTQIAVVMVTLDKDEPLFFLKSDF